MNGTFDEAFGANNDPENNAVLNLPVDMELDFFYDASTNRIGVAVPELLPTGTGVAADEGIKKPAVRSNEVENFYFVMTDRFANGDPSNDTGGVAGEKLEHGFDPTDDGFYHGGDIKGLIDNLNAATPDDFDKVYLDQQVAAHNETLTLLNGFADNTEAPALATLARELVTPVTAHRDRARTLLDAMK